MRRTFPLFQSHLDLAHAYWESLLTHPGTVVDATCGNGHDTLKLATLKPTSLWAMDIQEKAIRATKKRLEEQLSAEELSSIQLVQGSHATFPAALKKESVQLIVYNLGYLPGGDKSATTQRETTLKSLESALYLIQPGGAVSLTLYPGHPEGEKEREALLNFTSQLPPQQWSCCTHQWHNRQRSPILLLIQKALP